MLQDIFEWQVRCMNALASSLEIAVRNHFMAPEHAAAIWKKFVRMTELDVIRIEKIEKKEA